MKKFSILLILILFVQFNYALAIKLPKNNIDGFLLGTGIATLAYKLFALKKANDILNTRYKGDDDITINKKEMRDKIKNQMLTEGICVTPVVLALCYRLYYYSK